MQHSIKIQDIGFITPNVLQIQTSRPSDYDFEPGQACELAIDKPEWKNEKRPFTFTSLPSDGFLQFTIKVYPEHDGVTDVLQTLEKGDFLLIGDAWGAISYKGPGIFLAGGAGITPFISIFKNLAKNAQLQGNKLIFANKRESDIILRSNFENWLGKNFINVLSQDRNSSYTYGKIDELFIKNQVDNLDTNFYICGPPPMMDSMVKALKNLGVSKRKIIMEDFS